MFMDLYANNEMTKPSFLINPVFCCADVLHLFFILKYVFVHYFLCSKREREREKEKEKERERECLFFSKTTVCF